MKLPSQFAIGAVGLAVAAYVLYKAVPKVAAAVDGVVSGDNALTRGAKNAAGQRVTAYVGAGVVGTLGAAANTASGGYFSTLGQWLGGKAADAFLPDPFAAQDRYARPPTGNDYDETERLARRYPAPPAPVEYSDPTQYGFGI